MSVTRDVVTDLLPVYFSGEASADTRQLVENYFRENPEFERVARKAATPLEALTRGRKVAAWPGILSDADEREKRDLETVHKAVWRHKLHFGLALLFTLVPLAFVYSKGHFVWILVRNAPWDAGIYWLTAALFWALYLTRPRHRTGLLMSAIFFAVIPLLSLHGSWGAQSHVKNYLGLLWWAVFLWCMAASFVVLYFARARRRTAALTMAIFVTAFPIPFLVYSMLTGTPNILHTEQAPLWGIAAVMWFQYFRLRRKANAGEEECSW